jgi:hypothetical protein
MDYETKRRIKSLSIMLVFCIVFLSVVLLADYGYIQIKNGKKDQTTDDYKPLDIGRNNKERKDILKDALRN